MELFAEHFMVEEGELPKWARITAVIGFHINSKITEDKCYFKKK